MTESQVSTKVCISCSEAKTHEHFYKILSGYTGRCRPCYIQNQKKYAKKPTPGSYVRKGTGFKRLPKEVREGFLKMLGEGCTATAACAKYNLNTRTVFNWKRTGQLVL